tara:strand:- start:98 stop:286 length:189 start_codon:yes stop_codon:yes gene_type:complete
MEDRMKMIMSLEIAIDMLDRAEGTALYDVQKKVWGWSDKEYQQAIENLGILLLAIKNKGGEK